MVALVSNLHWLCHASEMAIVLKQMKQDVLQQQSYSGDEGEMNFVLGCRGRCLTLARQVTRKEGLAGLMH